MMPNYHTIEKHDKMFHDEQSCIVIDDGEYENIIIQYDVIKFSEDKTSNEIVKRGLLEKIFGGVGTRQELPTTP